MLLTLFLVFSSLTINAPEKEIPIKVTLAITRQAREQGLQGTDCLNEDEGMLFVFEKEGHYPFWMKNTSIPLALIFINAEDLIVDIKNAEPYSKKFIKGEKPYQFVLEVNQDFVTRHNITQGMTLTNPKEHIALNTTDSNHPLCAIE